MDVVSKSVLNVGSYRIEISIIADYDPTPLDNGNVKELDHNPLPSSNYVYDSASPFDYTDFAMDNFYHSAYFKTAYFKINSTRWSNHWNKSRYFVLLESPKKLQEYFSKQGYSKNNAWLKSVECLKSQASHIQDWFNEQWGYVGIVAEITETFTDDNGLIWSRELEYEHSSLWGIEWSWSCGNNSIIDNEQQFKDILPDLLPDKISLTDEQINNLWLNLE